MEKEKQIELAAAGLVIVLLLILILSLLYIPSTDTQKTANSRIYVKTTKVVSANGIVYGEETSSSVSSGNGVYKEIFSSNSFTNVPGRFYSQKTVYIQKNSGEPDIKVKIN